MTRRPEPIITDKRAQGVGESRTNYTPHKADENITSLEGTKYEAKMSNLPNQDHMEQEEADSQRAQNPPMHHIEPCRQEEG